MCPCPYHRCPQRKPRDLQPRSYAGFRRLLHLQRQPERRIQRGRPDPEPLPPEHHHPDDPRGNPRHQQRRRPRHPHEQGPGRRQLRRPDLLRRRTVLQPGLIRHHGWRQPRRLRFQRCLLVLLAGPVSLVSSFFVSFFLYIQIERRKKPSNGWLAGIDGSIQLTGALG